MIIKNIFFILIIGACLLHAEPIDKTLEKEVRDFVQKSVERDDGIIDYNDRQNNDRIIKNPRDWEAVLSKMLDIEVYSERELEIVVHIIEYRQSGNDPRIKEAIISMIDQLYNNALKEKERISEGKPIKPIRYHKSHKRRLDSYISRFADQKNAATLLEELMKYAVSWREDELLALTDPTYARIFISIKGVETNLHGDLLERLLPKLKQRGFKEKTILLGEETLRGVRDIHPRKKGTKLRSNRGSGTKSKLNGKQFESQSQVDNHSKKKEKIKFPMIITCILLFGIGALLLKMWKGKRTA